MLSRISKLVAVVVVYVYFTAWIYVHFYYEEFGISTAIIKIDYKSYLIFSWNVFTTPFFLVVTAGVALAAFLIYYFVKGRAFFKKPQNKFNTLLVLMVLLFPYLFFHARYSALTNYRNDRINTSNLKSIQFVFRAGSDLLSPALTLDSLKKLPVPLSGDIALVRGESGPLKLLGESDDKYIILNQIPYDSSLNLLPEGYIYFVAKSDVLITRIILRSTK